MKETLSKISRIFHVVFLSLYQNLKNILQKSILTCKLQASTRGRHTHTPKEKKKGLKVDVIECSPTR